MFSVYSGNPIVTCLSCTDPVLAHRQADAAAGIGLTMASIVIISLVNIVFPPLDTAHPADHPGSLEAGKHHGSSKNNIILGIALTMVSQACQCSPRYPEKPLPQRKGVLLTKW